MRVRLASEAPSYEGVRDNFAWPDHAIRTYVTGGLIAATDAEWILDPACGDASILTMAYRMRPFKQAVLCDISVAQVEAIKVDFRHERYVDDIVHAIGSCEGDLIVLTETLEHLESPDEVLELARPRFKQLVASSPIGDPERGRNHEHLWAWDEEGYEEMLRNAGWDPYIKVVLTYPGEPWNSQIWVAR